MQRKNLIAGLAVLAVLLAACQAAAQPAAAEVEVFSW